ncbi:hypothetical protein FIU87_04755 [Bacillus sp. THAF10]|uniref:DUF3889 domain-containing protein n=1 Tax=Bacillus sp. THAF10 TaxID=2587848 RepID=UPI00126977A5|nr:DUF3889 domain-containing protein [Bacillus sp. THAF10]QFT87959.1 hypothetical protein FIU87_04755 [Bacillus sp. THAF10]
MIRFTQFIIIIGVLLIGSNVGALAETYNESENQVPSYAKWGQLAMKKTKDKYPDADIVDYLHIGRQEGPINTTERFRLWLREGEKEFGVNVTITFDTKTENVKELKIEKVKRKGKRR